MLRRSRIGLSLAGAAAAVSLVACGSSEPAEPDFADLSAKKIADQSEKAMKALHSLTFDASITQDGEKLRLELSADRDGTCVGTIGFGGVTGELLSVDGAEYLRGDEAFWTKTAGADAKAVVTLLGDRWAKLDGGDQFSSFCDLDEFFDEIDKTSGATTQTKGKTAEIGGLEAVEITSNEDGGTVHGWVATEGKHYLLKVEQVGGKEPGTVTFSNFDEPVDAKTPAKDEYVDMAELG